MHVPAADRDRVDGPVRVARPIGTCRIMDNPTLIGRILGDAASAVRDDALVLLGPLQEYDRRHGGDLMRTLSTYLAAGSNASQAAGLLYLHRSGFLYRLARIERLLGLNLDDAEVRLALSIAVRALDPRAGTRT